MFRKPFLAPVFAAALLLPSATFACTIKGDTTLILEISALNTAIKDGDFDTLVSQVSDMGGFDITSMADQLKNVFPNGFESCIMLLQRRDVGGMTQSVVKFANTDSSLAVYWLSAVENDDFSLLSMSFNNDPSVMLETIR